MRGPALLRSFHHAFSGLVDAWRTQRNLRLHLLAAVLAVGLGLALGMALVELAILCLTIGLVLSAELFNTAVETLMDLVHPDHHPLAKAAKDVAAGAVLVTAGTAVLVGALLYGPHLIRLANALGFSP
ncbi:MAG: diacylglycerol kinase family protein [Chloroflexi bacterium]|nr:diacylglycerol kinase family protein [Chloroflexota bacterium]